MSIVFSAIVPHPPLIIPAVGKNNAKLLKNTREAFQKIEEDLYVSKPDTIIIISPHGLIQENSFTMNFCPEYSANMEEFGDFNTRAVFQGNISLAHRIRERMETRAPLQMISEPKLDYGSSIPLFLLFSHLPKIKVIPFSYSGLNLEANFKFGQLLKRELLVNKERIAIIASGDLSQKLSKKSPAGYSPKGKKFDKKIINYLSSGKADELMKIDENLVKEASECGLKSILILLGIMDGIKYQPQLLSYESPFGIGYMVMEFVI